MCKSSLGLGESLSEARGSSLAEGMTRTRGLNMLDELKKAPEAETSLVARTVKRLLTMWETQVWSLGWEDPLEKAMAPHSSTHAWKIPWRVECGRLQSMGSPRVGLTERLHFPFPEAVSVCHVMSFKTVAVQWLSHVRLCNPVDSSVQASLSFPVSWSCSNLFPSSWWCHPTVSSSVTPFSSCPQSYAASLVTQVVKSLPAMQETWVQPLGLEDPERRMATHSSILAWRIPWTGEPGGLQSTGSQRVRHDWATLSLFKLWILFSRFGGADRSGDNCHWKDRSLRSQIPRGWGTWGSLRVRGWGSQGGKWARAFVLVSVGTNGQGGYAA